MNRPELIVSASEHSTPSGVTAFFTTGTNK
jgi:hypothetical protein